MIIIKLNFFGSWSKWMLAILAFYLRYFVFRACHSDWSHTKGDAHNTSDDTKPSHDGKNIGQWVNYGIFFFQQFFLQAICHLSSQPLTTLFIVLFLMKRSIFNKLPELMESVFLKRFLSFHKSHFKSNLKRLYIEIK